MDIHRMLMDERPPGFDLENIDLNLFNLSVIQKYMDVCKLILLIRDHRCDLSFYKLDIAEYANKFDTQEFDEAPMPWPWDDPFKYWTKGKDDQGLGQRTRRKKQNKRRKSHKYKKSRK